SYPATFDMSDANTEMTAGMADPITSATTLAELIADSRSRKILRQHMPELMKSPWLSQVMGYPLERALRSLPPQFDSKSIQLKKVEKELKALFKN
ncbi:MAG: hypothetical protein R3281_18875, partial [Balneolaceae bacterium]|nr:hypothetical protein [Balneolaceae bacterium]